MQGDYAVMTAAFFKIGNVRKEMLTWDWLDSAGWPFQKIWKSSESGKSALSVFVRHKVVSCRCLSLSRGTRLARFPPRTSSLGDAGASLCCFSLWHAGKELLGALAHFLGAQVFFVRADAPAIAKRVHKTAISVAPELITHRH
jgi:hypothetical protein